MFFLFYFQSKQVPSPRTMEKKWLIAKYETCIFIVLLFLQFCPQFLDAFYLCLFFCSTTIKITYAPKQKIKLRIYLQKKNGKLCLLLLPNIQHNPTMSVFDQFCDPFGHCWIFSEAGSMECCSLSYTN